MSALPNLAEEVSQTISQNREEPGAAARSVVVDSVKLVGGASLPDDVRRKLVASVPTQAALARLASRS